MPGATGTVQSLNTTRRFSPALTTTMPPRSQKSFSQNHLTHERLTVFPTPPRQIRTKPILQHIKKGGLISQPALFYCSFRRRILSLAVLFFCRLIHTATIEM